MDKRTGTDREKERERERGGGMSALCVSLLNYSGQLRGAFIVIGFPFSLATGYAELINKFNRRMLNERERVVYQYLCARCVSNISGRSGC